MDSIDLVPGHRQ